MTLPDSAFERQCALCGETVMERWWQRFFDLPMCRDKETCFRRCMSQWTGTQAQAKETGER